MLTGIKLALGLSALAATGTIAGLQGDKSPERPNNNKSIISKASDDLPVMLATEQDGRLDKRVTLDANNASLNDVLKQLSQAGLSFVANEDEVGNSKLTLNIKDQPLRDAANAVADAFGGHWTHHGDVYVFHRGKAGAFDYPVMNDMKGFDQLKGGLPFGFMTEPKGENFSFKMDPKDLKQFQDSMGEFAKKMAELGSKYHDNMSEADKKKLETEMKALGEQMRKNGKDFQFKWSPDDMKGLKELKDNPMIFNWSDGNGVKGWSKEDQKKFQDEMKKMGKELKDNPMIFKWSDGNGVQGWSKEDQKKFQDEMKKMGKDMRDNPMIFKWSDGKALQGWSNEDQKKFREDMLKMQKELKDNKFYNWQNGDGVQIWTGKDGKDFSKAYGFVNKGGKLFMKDKNGKLHELNYGKEDWSPVFSKEKLKDWKATGERTKKLINSLTPSQKSKMKTQGYLKLSDLTDAQRQLIEPGMRKGGDWTMSYSVDGKEIKIKSGKG